MARDGPDRRIAPDSTGSHLPAPPDLPACRPCFACLPAPSAAAAAAAGDGGDDNNDDDGDTDDQ